MENRKPIRSYRDFDVYQNLYKAMLIVLKDIVPRLPKEEKYDLADQMRRGCKSAPALFAEGFAKRYQKKNWEKYLTDCLGECSEMTHHLSVCIDAYPKYVSVEKCKEVLDLYDHSSKQLHKLRDNWRNFHEERSQ
ncbi:MAG: four helix bundle protein [bacterium]|nr:four helix bundle protein [bacterium]